MNLYKTLEITNVRFFRSFYAIKTEINLFHLEGLNFFLTDY